jgi:tRNA 2-selenouridine synthase
VENLHVPAITAEEAVNGPFVIADVRAPCEFAEGHVPGSLNVPFLDDAQRARVGTVYKQAGAQAARLAAVDLVSHGLPVFLRNLALLTRGGDRLAVMCWRGGERSRNVVLLLALIGVHAARVEGGYRAYRRWVIQSLAAWRPELPVFTLYGHTGSGKTAVLRALDAIAPELSPRPYVVDLEGIALHRGSLLGGLNQPGQRTQKDFDALAWEALRRADGDYLVVEGESAKIGRIFLPETVANLVREGLPVLVRATPEQRADLIMREYSPETWDAQDRSRFRRSLSLIGCRLAPERVASLRSAFEDGRFAEVVRELLVEYYDPLYQRSSVEGKHFLLDLEIGDDPSQDARALAAAITRHLEEQASPHLV